MPREIIIEKELLFSLRFGNQYTVKEISKLLHVSKSTIERKLVKYNIPSFYPDTYQITEQELEYLYKENNLTSLEIANKLGCSKKGVLYKLHRANIKTKTRSEIHSGKPKSEIHRKRLSETKKRMYKEGKLKTWNKNKTSENDNRILSGESHPLFCGEVLFPVCPYCRKIFEISSSRYNISIKEGILMHCNVKCARKNTVRPQYEDNNPNWKGGFFPYYSYYFKRIRDDILERASYKSELSGNSAEIIDVHHIYPIRLFMEKFIDLCLKPYIPYIKNKSFKVIPYNIVPDIFFEEANRKENLICLTRHEHGDVERLGKYVRLMLSKLVKEKYREDINNDNDFV